MPEKYLSPAELVAAVNKEFGSNTLVLARDAVGLVRPRISTGSIALDLNLGGGYPEGAITILEGDSGSSKSWSMNTYAKNFLDKFPEAIYILVNAEGTNDHLFLQMLGVDIDRTFFLQPDSGEQAWDAAIFAAQRAQKVFIGVDSLDTLVPMKELEGEVGDAQYAPAAKMNNKGFRKLIAAMKSDITTDDHRVTFVVITQLREAIGVMFGDNKCFQFDSRVVLADGSVEKIGNIVNKRMEVSVRTVSADGTVSSAPVVGWHDNGSGGSFIRVVCSKAGGNGRTRLTCTPDHHIRMFDGSYKEAGSLVAGDLVTAQGVGIVGECPSRKALVLSGLFGDGTLAHAHSNVSSGTHSLKVTHCTDQADYLEWKRGFFDGWVQLEPHTSHNGSAVSFSTNPFSDYVGLHRSMGFSRRVTDDFLKEVGLRELAVWFMDDGSYVRGYKGWGAGTASLACKKYSQQEREALAEHLAAMGCAPTNLDSRRIFWTGDRLRNFASVVAPYIPECMRRKLPPKMDLRKFDPSLWPVTRVAPSTILWPSEVLEVSRYCRESRCSQKKFDITVAGTHNYFVDGVAVHNCSVGGRGKKFAATTIVRLSRTKALRSEGSTAAEKMTYGLEIEASIIKNKGWGEGEKIRFNLYKENHGGFRRGDIDNVTELIPYLLLYKIVKKKGAWITLDNGDSYNGDEAMANELRGNSELLEWAMSSVREAHAHRYEDRKEVEEPAKTDKPEKAEKPVPKNLRTLSKRK